MLFERRALTTREDPTRIKTAPVNKRGSKKKGGEKKKGEKFLNAARNPSNHTPTPLCKAHCIQTRDATQHKKKVDLFCPPSLPTHSITAPKALTIMAHVGMFENV